MPYSTLFKRQLGLVYQDRLEDEVVLITGSGEIISYLVTELVFLGFGTSQGLIGFPASQKVTTEEIPGQNLLLSEDVGKPLWLAVKNRVSQNFSEGVNIMPVEDADATHWDTVFVVHLSDTQSPPVPKGANPIYAIASKTAAYVGSINVHVDPAPRNVLTSSLSAIAAGLAAQELLRRRRLIKPSEFLSSNLEMRYVIQKQNIYKICEEHIKKHQGLPFNVRAKIGGEPLPAYFEPFYEDVKIVDSKGEKTEHRLNPDRVIVRCTLPEDSHLTRVVDNLVEILDDDSIDLIRYKDALLFSPFKETRIENGHIIDVDVDVPVAISGKKIFFVGVGGLGSWFASLFSMSNTSNCRLVVDDIDDRVEEHNLNRQILFDRSSIGIPKALAAKKAIERLNPLNQVTALEFSVDIGTANNILNKDSASLEEYLESKKNVAFLPGTNIPANMMSPDLVVAHEIKDADLIVCGPDNIRTRYICSLVGKLGRIPVISAGGETFEGKVDLFLPDGDCYVCRYGEKSKYEMKIVSCTGTIPTLSIVTTISIVSAMQAAIGIAYLSGACSPSRLRHYVQYYGRYQMLATCDDEMCRHVKKKDCPNHLNLPENENPFKFF